ncbi:3'-5' exonuclease [Thermosipho ferrireducens]|uniref:3'-5' exonuclease n=1 Tax=Thermosipho ferrireducens TaxID=2571116 RepID=A0ABX7S6Q4_9BACT|nr:3'-5' exonuclease [Thermosipho ferrireducens]QTA38263.1 3'-5' exonuclease [Thermosipho ferrireducens]
MFDETVFCVMDTETTGLNPFYGDRIIEVAIVPVYKGKIVEEWIYHSLINPKIRIPALVEKIHKISNSEIANAPGLENMVNSIRAYSKGTVFVMHNANFDLSFVDFATKEIGEFPISFRYIDTLEICQVLYGRKRSLESLIREFKIGENVPHRALEDAILTAKVFIKLVEKIGYRHISEFIRKWQGRGY